jgi:hypothetical protein
MSCSDQTCRERLLPSRSIKVVFRLNTMTNSCAPVRPALPRPI